MVNQESDDPEKSHPHINTHSQQSSAGTSEHNRSRRHSPSQQSDVNSRAVSKLTHQRDETESHDSGSDGEHSRNFWRPVRACTHCRQQKIKCDAAETQPHPCSKCAKSGKECVVDPHFRPKKGGQVMHLREDIKRLRSELQRLQSGSAASGTAETDTEDSCHESEASFTVPTKGPHQSKRQRHSPSSSSSRDQSELHSNSQSLAPTPAGLDSVPVPIPGQCEDANEEGHPHLQQPTVAVDGPWTIEDVTLSVVRGRLLHNRFTEDYLPRLPIMETDSPEELYGQSTLLFWSIMVTAALGDADPELYLSLQEPIKRLLSQVTFLETPRSTHIVQALLMLTMWPLANEKMLDDSSYRYVSLARCLGQQLGTHRGRFIYEFSRKQKLMPNAVKWRTRTWVGTYICEQMSSAAIGVPSTMPLDYLVNKSSIEPDWLTAHSRGILRLSIFYAKMTSVMGSGISSPDGLLSAREREPMISVLQHSLSQLAEQLPMQFEFVEVYYLYIKCMLCSYAFLPDTPEDVQNPMIVEVYNCATRLITVTRAYVGHRRITEFPVYIRNAASFAAMLLFRLHLMPQFPAGAVESARQSIVTVHHLYRNVPSSWLLVHNDITRIAKVLESLNYVLATQPQLLTTSRSVLSRMRSHLTFSLFYELLWIIHEARRLNSDPKTEPTPPAQQQQAQPLPLFTQIAADEYTTKTYTSPNGTTLTMLVPTVESQQSPTVGQNMVMSSSASNNALASAGASTRPRPGKRGRQKASASKAALPAPPQTHGGASAGATTAARPPAAVSAASPVPASVRRLAPIVPAPFPANPQPISNTPPFGDPDLNNAMPQPLNNDNMLTDLDMFDGQSTPIKSAQVPPRADLAQLEALFAGVDWMNQDGDEFLGWMPLAGEFPM